MILPRGGEEQHRTVACKKMKDVCNVITGTMYKTFKTVHYGQALVRVLKSLFGHEEEVLVIK